MTARQIGEAAAELRAFAEQVGELAQSRVLGATFGGVHSALAGPESRGRSLVDHSAWRGAQLMVGPFGLVFGYRIISSRLDARK